MRRGRDRPRLCRAVPFEATVVDLASLDRPHTQIMVNLGNPDLAFKTAMRPNDGVGLARMEFIISEHIGIHPMALVQPEKVTSAADREAIARSHQAPRRAGGRSSSSAWPKVSARSPRPSIPSR